jgi:hypothetical protein
LLRKTLERLALRVFPFSADGTENLLIVFPDDAYGGGSRVRVLVAHHDRVPGSPGANDNAAAVFQLLALAERLLAGRRRHNTLIVFTDREELGAAGRVVGQGSARIGEFLSRFGKRSFDFLVFDTCGRGDTLILSSAHRRLLTETPLGTTGMLGGAVIRLENEVESALRPMLGQRLLRLDSPFSDSIGLLAAGHPAALCTLLPAAEASHWRDMVEIHRPFTRDDLDDTARRSLFREIAPHTWKRLHTPQDTVDSLEEGAFILMERVLDTLVATNSTADR